METELSSFFSVQTIVFCIVVYIVVQIFRSIIVTSCILLSKFFPKMNNDYIKDIWNEWILPASPILTGAIIALLVKDYPYPELFSKTLSGRIFFGLVAGGASGYVYRFFRFHIKKYLPEEIKEKIMKIVPSVDFNEELNNEELKNKEE